MKKLVLILPLVVAAGPAVASSYVKIAAGDRHFCLLDAEGAKCWGVADQAIAPPLVRLSDPRGVWAGGDNTCVQDGSRLKCWGTNERIAAVPELQDLRQVAVGETHACVDDGGRTRCWGLERRRDNDEVQLRESEYGVDPLTTQPLAVIYDQTCGTAPLAREWMGGFYCETWGLREGGAYYQPHSLPLQVAGHDDTLCLVWADPSPTPGARFAPSGRLGCWGISRGSIYDDSRVLCGDKLERPTELDVGARRVCVLDGIDVRCTTRYDIMHRCTDFEVVLDEDPDFAPVGLKTVTELRGATQIAVAGDVVCAVVGDDVRCYDLAAGRVASLPAGIAVSVFTFDGRLGDALRRTASYAYAEKAEFLTRTAELADASGASDAGPEAARMRALLMMSVAPVIETIDSAFFARHVQPRFATALAEAKAQAGVSAMGQLPRTQPLQRVTLQTLAAVLQALRTQVAADPDRERIDRTLAAVGRAVASGGASADVATVAVQLRESHDLYERLAAGTRTQGLGLATLALGELLGE